MEIAFTDTALSHLRFWKKAGNESVQAKIQKLLKAIAEDPYSGIGQPEQLNHEWRGFWSGRITKKTG
ncbi:type II toxin-antitoxin system YoeB family toxin [Niabella ginsengisoli]|uniref:Putative mRNA interferase YoeB n=1 Tax=Niabella ginsengisoli TaxID=522298 RepID=A0ABS9SL37_9BACT|nr:type II toxin-antitoxin system YoeB family toxin [Niabella ginsengisoli]MCH5599097.1 type II toxin-antitoxin system YoeB family toxin [Niabella ginsengisoli]